jgi:pimeloyl-ACP methyl ester carboxylesterase
VFAGWPLPEVALSMSDVLFIQGAGADVHDEWDVHLVESLRRALGPSYTVRYPRMPDEAEPTMATWQPAFALSAIVLISAPFIGEGGWDSEEIAPRPDFGERLGTIAPVLLYHGEEDDVVPVAHVERYAMAIPKARVRRLGGRDHQLNNDLSEVARDIRESMLGFARRERP